MLTIGYARVSTTEQAYKLALDQQVFRLMQAGAVKVYADVASRTKDDRAALISILSKVEAGEIEKVLVTRLDRITSSPGLFERIGKIFQKHGCILSALDETVDVHSVDGEFTAGLQVYFARREVRTIQLRVKKAKEVGRMHNRASSSVPWGYRNVDGRYILDHTPYLCLLSDRPGEGEEFPGRTKAELGRDVVDLFFKGGSLSEATRLVHEKYGICKFSSRQQQNNSSSKVLIFDDDSPEIKLPINKRAGIFRWSPDGIRLYLFNPVLCGHTPYNTHYVKEDGKRGGRKPVDQWDVRFNTHPEERLITDAQKRQLEQIMAWNSRGGRWGPKSAYPLTGIVVCGSCGRSMKCQGVNSGRKNHVYYQCKNYIQRACPQQKMARFDAIEEYVIARLTTKAKAIAKLAQTPPEYVEPQELFQLRSTLAGLEQLGHNPALEAAKADIQLQIQTLAAKSQQQEVVDVEKRELLISTFSNEWYWEGLLDENKRDIYRALIKRVVVKDGVVVDVELLV